jgi:hypothetical protein
MDIHEIMGRHFNASLAQEFVEDAQKAGKPLADVLRDEYLSFTSDPDVADEVDWDDIAEQCENWATEQE